MRTKYTSVPSQKWARRVFVANIRWDKKRRRVVALLSRSLVGARRMLPIRQSHPYTSNTYTTVYTLQCIAPVSQLPAVHRAPPPGAPVYTLVLSSQVHNIAYFWRVPLFITCNTIVCILARPIKCALGSSAPGISTTLR